MENTYRDRAKININGVSKCPTTMNIIDVSSIRVTILDTGCLADISEPKRNVISLFCVSFIFNFLNVD